MKNEPTSDENTFSRHRSRRLLERRNVLVLAVVVVLVLSGLILIGKLNNDKQLAIVGGSPYPLSVLLADTSAKPLPVNFQAKEMRAIGNIPSRSQFVKALDSQDVSVSYDGISYSNDQIAWQEATCLQAAIEIATNNSFVEGLDPSTAISELESSSYCLDQSIAVLVFEQATEEAAITSGHGSTLAQARAYAGQQLAAQESFDASPNAPQLPAGVTAQSMTMCSACILTYQKDLDLQYEITAITGTTTSGPTQSAKIVDWFSNVMANTTTLEITNVPSATAANLPSFLSWARSAVN